VTWTKRWTLRRREPTAQRGCRRCWRTATIVLDVIAAGLLWWFAGRPRPTSAAIATTFTAVGLCVLTGLATTIIALNAGVVTLVPAVIFYILGAVFVIRCVASMKHAAAASTV